MMEHAWVPVHLILEVHEHHGGWDGGQAEAEEAEDKDEAERPHQANEDVFWARVWPRVKQRRITGA